MARSHFRELVRVEYHFWTLLTDTLLPGVVVPVSILSISKIGRFKTISYLLRPRTEKINEKQNELLSYNYLKNVNEDNLLIASHKKNKSWQIDMPLRSINLSIWI